MSSLPFDRLSIEVIQEIFLSCLPEDNNLNQALNVVQLVISQVSTRWRSIALNTRQLWDSFILSVYNDWQQADSVLQLASLWLHRAGSLPITLKVWVYLPQHDPHIQDLYRLISSHRFKSLTGDLKLFCLPLRNKSYEESFASLESLRLDISNEFSVGSFQARQSPDGDKYCRLPSLRCLHINFRWTNIHWQGVLPMIPWHQLSKLILNNIEQVSTVIEIMCECKALVECRLLTTTYQNDHFVTPSTSPSLPHLRNLSLTSLLPIPDLIKILSTSNVPNLTSICITLFGRTYDSLQVGTDLLSSQLDAPLQQLEEFTFADSFNIVDVRIFLCHMASLRKLALHGCVSLDHDTAKQISTGQLGPHIDTLSFRSCRSVKRVLNMIEKRQENAKSGKGRNLAPFVHVRLGCPVDSGDKYKEKVERLERQHNVRIQMDPIAQVFDDDDSEEEH